MVREVSDAAEFAREIRGPGLVVVDFFMDSCGPCKMIAPILEQLAARHPTVKFIKVSVDRNEDVCRSRNVGAFPTFQFFVRGNFVDELKGADPSALESKIIKYKKDADPFAGKGKTLGAPTGDAPLDPRAARLKALGISDDSSSNPRPAAAASSASKPASAAAMDVDNEDEEDEAIAKAIALSIQEAKGAGAGVTTHSNSKGTIVCDGNKCTVVKSAAGSKDAETMPMDMDISNTIVGSSAPAVPLGKSSVKSAAEQDAEDDAEAHAALQAEHDADTAWGEEMVPVPVNDELLSQLIDMGFSDVVSRKGAQTYLILKFPVLLQKSSLCDALFPQYFINYVIFVFF